jgi:3,4-dehydroadipyl-CoA semialdehyde dehydrogenase
MGYAARAKLVGTVADVLVANRAKYEGIAIANSGNTKADAAIDIDGGIGTLKYYARLAASLGDARALLDEKPVRLSKAENYQAIHLMVPRRGVAVHINAFNFPSWGLWEKAAVALIAGMPVLAKPASATALLAHEMVRDVIAANVLPAGALNLLVGGAGDLLNAVMSDDVIAFTGSADTAMRVRGHANVLAKSVSVNIEADSINAAVLAPDAAGGGAAFDAFVREVVREMTVKAGQKCTAIRRIVVPADKADAVRKRSPPAQGNEGWAIRARRTPAWVRWSRAASGRRRPSTAFAAWRRKQPSCVAVPSRPGAVARIDRDKSAFVAPTLLKAQRASKAQAVHEVEVFGPAATVVPYRNEQEAAQLVARGGSSLVTSLYGEDHAFLARMVSEIGPSHGRLLVVDPAIASAHTGHGIVMPQCNHGGPGRAGNGEELGGLYGLRFYHQRLAVQGSTDLLSSLQAARQSALTPHDARATAFKFDPAHLLSGWRRPRQRHHCLLFSASAPVAVLAASQRGLSEADITSLFGCFFIMGSSRSRSASYHQPPVLLDHPGLGPDRRSA